MNKPLEKIETNSKSEPSIFFKGQEIPLSIMPKELRDLIEIYARWEEELAKARIEVFKLEAAIRGIGIEVEHRLTELNKAG